MKLDRTLVESFRDAYSSIYGESCDVKGELTEGGSSEKVSERLDPQTKIKMQDRVNEIRDGLDNTLDRNEFFVAMDVKYFLCSPVLGYSKYLDKAIEWFELEASERGSEKASELESELREGLKGYRGGEDNYNRLLEFRDIFCVPERKDDLKKIIELLRLQKDLNYNEITNGQNWGG